MEISGADELVKYAVENKCSGSTLDVHMRKNITSTEVALQSYSDGGVVPKIGGAFGVLIILHTGSDQAPQRELLGYRYEFAADAKSAFNMELRGLEYAAGVCRQACS